MALQNPDQARIAMENGATVAGGTELIDKVKLTTTCWQRRLIPTYDVSVSFCVCVQNPKLNLRFGYHIAIIY